MTTSTTPSAPPTPPGGTSAAEVPPSRRVVPRWVAWLVPTLLVAALALLVVGLATSASAWLAGSLGCSVVAAVLLILERLVGRRTPAASVSASSSALMSPSARAGAPADDDVPDSAAGLVDLDAPDIDPDDPDAVWVVDGRPRYHARDCAVIASLDAEPIPRSQAVEDGFVSCSLCAVAPAAPAAPVEP